MRWVGASAIRAASPALHSLSTIYSHACRPLQPRTAFIQTPPPRDRDARASNPPHCLSYAETKQPMAID